jgi:hypothetical protein
VTVLSRTAEDLIRYHSTEQHSGSNNKMYVLGYNLTRIAATSGKRRRLGSRNPAKRPWLPKRIPSSLFLRGRLSRIRTSILFATTTPMKDALTESRQRYDDSPSTRRF